MVSALRTPDRGTLFTLPSSTQPCERRESDTAGPVPEGENSDTIPAIYAEPPRKGAVNCCERKGSNTGIAKSSTHEFARCLAMNDQLQGEMGSEHPFVWHELVTDDQETSGAFFCRLFGWTLKEVDAGTFGTYTLFQKDGRDIAGMMNPTPDTPGTKSYWHSYVSVEDVDECAATAAEIGGNVVVPPHDVPDVGRICVVSDPNGAITHLLQPV